MVRGELRSTRVHVVDLPGVPGSFCACRRPVGRSAWAGSDIRRPAATNRSAEWGGAEVRKLTLSPNAIKPSASLASESSRALMQGPIDSQRVRGWIEPAERRGSD